ncbi:hypothetical protein CKAH01_08868 [Colletotrichum kahawae]|uniref:Uncharacterized protein n=1 Tax=Colletotrichum kahawae TaxID=34407 RepID=A0AAD9Y1V2_COLKA|nr:hypothetical protein CKAH01_08868 [Colletotrichum kahawae]
MSWGTHLGGLCSSTTWSFFVVFALVLLTGNVAYADVCNYDGGWSLRSASSCTSIASQRCGSTWDDSQVLCCPDRYVCSGKSDFENQYCCKDKDSCTEEAIKDPKCPDPTMSLWGTNDTNPISSGLWCCAPGNMGVYKNSGEIGGLAFLCTGTAETALATGLYSAVPQSQCSMSSSEDSSASVPAGAIAGGVVGGVAGIALVIAGMYFFLKKKKRRDPSEQPSTEAPTQEGQPWPQQLRVDSQRSWRRPSELETVEPRLEMNGVKPTYELDAAEEQERDRDISPLSPPR